MIRVARAVPSPAAPPTPAGAAPAAAPRPTAAGPARARRARARPPSRRTRARPSRPPAAAGGRRRRRSAAPGRIVRAEPAPADDGRIASVQVAVDLHRRGPADSGRPATARRSRRGRALARSVGGRRAGARRSAAGWRSSGHPRRFSSSRKRASTHEGAQPVLARCVGRRRSRPLGSSAWGSASSITRASRATIWAKISWSKTKPSLLRRNGIGAGSPPRRRGSPCGTPSSWRRKPRFSTR